MSSCNALPVKLAINPSKTGGCAIKRSCNASLANWALSLLFSVVVHLRDLVTHFACFSASRASSPDGPFATTEHALRFPARKSILGSRVLTATASGLPLCWPCGIRVYEQYFWRLALRGSGINNSLQLQHFFLFIPAIGNRPPDRQCYGKK